MPTPGYAPLSFAPTAPRSSVASIFDTKPAAPAAPSGPVALPPELAQKLLAAVHAAREHALNNPAKFASIEAEDQLKAGLQSGEVVAARLTDSVTVLLPKADDLNASKSFFYRTSGGVAGTQYFGPFDV